MAGVSRLMEVAAWYSRRLRTMQAGELLRHSRRAAHGLIPVRHADADELRDGVTWPQAFERFRSGTDRPLLLDRHYAQGIADAQPQRVSALLHAAEMSADLSFQYFGYPAVRLKRPIDWNHDPIAGVRWPATPSARINHRRSGADVKWIWELNRLQHLPILAEAWLFTGDARYSAAALDQLDSWVDQNPPGRGIAWRGSFEIGLRAVSIMLALQGLRDSPHLTPDRFRRFAGMLAESAHRCWRDRSLFSSANNHLIGEMAGLVVVAMLLPELRRSAHWEQQAIGTLCAEASKQVLPDGCGAEQSVAYQMFTVELINLVSVLLLQRDGHAPAALTEAVARSTSFLARVVGGNDPDPHYGDDDEGFALRLGAQQNRSVRDHLGIIAAGGCACVDPAVIRDSLEAGWFRAAGHGRAALFGGPETPELVTADFLAPDGGLVVLRTGQRRITMDVGPLGYLSIAAHGHADALSVTLSMAGHDVISDPGTGSYYGHPDWRAVLRGTRAHPTVCVDDQDQSVIGGPFMWSRHARVTVHGVDLAAGVIDAEHDGYARLAGGVIHRRWLVAPPGDRSILVVDLITGTGEHSCVQTWPLHPDLTVDAVAGGHLISRRGSPVLQALYASTAEVSIDAVRGDQQSNLGWWSDRLETRIPAWWLRSGCRSRLPAILATLLSPLDGIATRDLSIGLHGDSWEATWFDGADARAATARLTVR